MTPELASGQILVGRYRLDRRLDEGGMSVVWAGTQLVSGKAVALKLLKAEAAKDEAGRRRMLREARAACAVIHRNVVEIHDVLELSDGCPVLVMDLLEGESLRDRLLRRKSLSLAETATLVLPVVLGVGTAHAAGVIHRDLKPENIFIAKEHGEICVKVLDFGIAKLVASASNFSSANALTSTGTMLGTPYYMAPEQILGEPIDHRADIWSVGVILYECLVGERPTEAENIGKILKRVLTNEIEPISARKKDLPADIKSLVDRMLSQNVAERPASLHEVADVLAAYADGVRRTPFGPPSTAPESPFQMTERAKDSVVVTPVVTDRIQKLGSPASVDPASGLAETLIAPQTRATSAAPQCDARATSAAPQCDARESKVPSGGGEKPSDERAQGAESAADVGRLRREVASDDAPQRKRPSRLTWFGLAAVLGVSGVGIYYFVRPKGVERPYTPASVQVANASANCPAGMGFVPGGPFRMGSDEGKDDERPVHEVKIDPFCMDILEVSVRDYNECAQKGTCRVPESTVRWGDIPDNLKERDSLACNGYQNSNLALPMNCISWEDANAYCEAMGKHLPTEAEWEFAAAGGNERRLYPWGIEPPSRKRLNFCDRACVKVLESRGAGKQRPMVDEEDGAGETAATGSYPEGASKFGMLDMAGNVWEWTKSPYCTYPEHACSSQYRVFRGGGWGGAFVANVRTTTRMWSHPAYRYNDVGFRCVKGQ